MAKRQAILSAALVGLFAPAHAAEPLTLNDIPSIMQKLGDCGVETSMFSRSSTVICKSSKPWVAVHEDGAITVFFEANGLKVNGSGRTLNAALSDLAARTNKTNSEGKRLIEALGPMLPTQ